MIIIVKIQMEVCEYKVYFGHRMKKFGYGLNIKLG